MTEKYFLVENCKIFSETIKQTLKENGNNIRFTCFDVSNRYLIFGTTSGALVIFNRQPYQFMKLLPTKVKHITKLAISKDELYIGSYSQTMSTLIIVKDYLSTTPYIEETTIPKDVRISVLQWCKDQLYCGDHSGRISVSSTTSFLSRAIFNSLFTQLMVLDSAIIQLDAFEEFLLISTIHKTFICHTEKEHYKQVGLKSRNGVMGACFVSISKSEKQIPIIYCARPGLRLWQADLDGNVLYTLNFKSCLHKKQDAICTLHESEESTVKVCSDVEHTLPADIAFQHIFKISDRFILTLTKNYILIFDPNATSLVFWHKFEHIRDIGIVNNYLYIWDNNDGMQVYELMNIEQLVVAALTNNQLTYCAQLCLRYSQEILNMAERSKKIHLLLALRSKLHDNSNVDLVALHSLLDKLEKTETYSMKATQKRIAIIENAYYHSTIDTHVESINSNKLSPLNILNQQFQLNELYQKHMPTPHFCNLIDAMSLDDYIQLTTQYISEDYSVPLIHWAKRMCVTIVCDQQVCVDSLHVNSKTAIFDMLMDIYDNFRSMQCVCGFPLPQAHCEVPEFLPLAEQFLKDHEERYKTIPYFLKYYIKEDNSNIPLIIQFSDLDILNVTAPKFTYDVWDQCINLLIQLREKHSCLQCSKTISINGALDWTPLAMHCVKYMGASNTIKLLQTHANNIPNGALHQDFFQFCILNAEFPPTANLSNIGTSQMDTNFYNLLNNRFGQRYKQE